LLLKLPNSVEGEVVPKIDPIQDFSGMVQTAPQDSLRLILWGERKGKTERDFNGDREKTKIFFVSTGREYPKRTLSMRKEKIHPCSFRKKDIKV
jgi:hypothetical protein